MSHPSTAWLSLTNQYPDPGWGWLEEPHPVWIYWSALLNSTGRVVDWKQHYPPSAEAGTAADGSWTQLWAPKSRGCWSNPSALEPGQEPLSDPFPPMLLQFKVLLGRNSCSAKSKLRFFLGWQTILQFFSRLISCSSKGLSCSRPAACALAEGRACSEILLP